MAVKKVITPDDLSTDDFVIQGNKVHHKVEHKVYKHTFFPGIVPGSGADTEDLHVIQIVNGFGVVHFDFIIDPKSDGRVFQLPPECPTPRFKLSCHTAGGAIIYIPKGSRVAAIKGGVPKKRYMGDLVGFFG